MNLPVAVRAPATSANLGPGFDCVGVALDLWNELEVSQGDGVEVWGEGEHELSRSGDHLGLRAFALLAPTEGRRFVFRNGIPLARGLGSSAATIALGLVAAAQTADLDLRVDELLGLALQLEPHADNLAPALAGGVCLTWPSGDSQRVARIADDLPLEPIAVVPEARVETAAARAALPTDVSHADAVFTATHAVLLGAGLASNEPALLAEAFSDRLHEPYRGPLSPVYGPIRDRLPAGALGVTISGSGPTVLVWAGREDAAACAHELAGRFPDSKVMRLGVATAGAGLIPR